jgi:beta-lactamase class A
MNLSFRTYHLDYSAPLDVGLQRELELLDAKLRDQLGMTAAPPAVGLLDLKRLRLALLRPDREEYAATLPKIGILLAYFQLHPHAVANLAAQTRRELGLMIKASDNELAAKFSQELGLARIQSVLNSYHFYAPNRGGGLWLGKHYGRPGERLGSPVGDNSHAATVRQLVRYFLLLEQGKLISPEASRVMREIFASPEIPHDEINFVKALAGRPVEIIRKWGAWEDWAHDAAVVTGGGRHYILVALTRHPRGAEYLEALAQAVDDLICRDLG